MRVIRTSSSDESNTITELSILVHLCVFAPKMMKEKKEQRAIDKTLYIFVTSKSYISDAIVSYLFPELS